MKRRSSPFSADGGAAGRAAADPSFWLETASDDLTPRPSLAEDRTVDVAIVGGGFSGLWTAYYLLRGAPQLEVAIVERAYCGAGASGRNGGWCSPRFPLDAAPLARRFGIEQARQTLVAQAHTVEEIGRLCSEEGIDAGFRPSGLLSIARSERQGRALEATWNSYAALGLAEGNRLLSAEETFERVHATRITRGLTSRAGATIHPGRLVRGLARAVERRGAAIYEATPALRIIGGGDAAVVTPQGTVRARRAVVAAAEAGLIGMPGFGRQLLPMSSMIVLTAPLTDAQWRDVGWECGASLSSVVHTKNYLTRTEDGRILYGSRGAPYLYGSRMPEAALVDERRFARMRETVREWWPALRDVPFTNAWGGYLAVPRDWMPSVGYDPDSRLAHLHGYTGRGVATSALCARLLAGMIGGWTTGLEGLPLRDRNRRHWELEPLRWAGVRYVQSAFARIDAAEEAGRSPPLDAPLADYLGGE